MTHVNPQYAPVEKYIHEEHMEREVAIADRMADLVVAFWHWVEGPPRDSEVIINGRFNTEDAARHMRFGPQ